MAKSGTVCSQCGKVHGRLPEVLNKWCDKHSLCPDCRRERQQERRSSCDKKCGK